MTAIGVSGWMFLMVPAHLGSLRQDPESRKMVVVVVLCAEGFTYLLVDNNQTTTKTWYDHPQTTRLILHWFDLLWTRCTTVFWQQIRDSLTWQMLRISFRTYWTGRVEDEIQPAALTNESDSLEFWLNVDLIFLSHLYTHNRINPVQHQHIDTYHISYHNISAHQHTNELSHCCCVLAVDVTMEWTKSLQRKWLMAVFHWRCWLGGRKGIRLVKTERCGAGMVICLRWGADLHMAQLTPLPLTVSCSRKSRLVYLSATGSAGKSRTKSREP